MDKLPAAKRHSTRVCGWSRFRLLGFSLVLILIQSLSAQTAIQLANQQNANFSGFPFTFPFRLVGSLPGTCTIGQMVFNTSATAGQNLYGCTSANVWTLQSGSGGVTITHTTNMLAGDNAGNAINAGFAPSVVVQTTATQSLTNKTIDGVPPATFAFLDPTSSIQSQLNGKQASLGVTISGSPAAGKAIIATSPSAATWQVPGGGAAGVEVYVNGTAIGTEAGLNLIPASGMTQACTDNVGLARIDCTPGFNTAVIPTYTTIQNNPLYCTSTNGTSTYTCAMPNSGLTAYAAGQVFDVVVDTTNVTSAGACSLKIDLLTAKAIKQADGSTDPIASSLLPGYPFRVYYDGTVFRLFSNSANSQYLIGTNVEAWSAQLDTWSGKTSPTGTVVGTTDSQTLTNKSIASTEITGLPTFPSGTIVGTTDTQTLTNKTVDAVTPTVFGYIDPTSSIQTQLNARHTGSGTSGQAAFYTGSLTQSSNAFLVNSFAGGVHTPDSPVLTNQIGCGVYTAGANTFFANIDLLYDCKPIGNIGTVNPRVVFDDGNSHQLVFSSQFQSAWTVNGLTFTGTVPFIGIQGTINGTGVTGCSATIGSGSTTLAGFYTSGTTGTCTITLTHGATYTHGAICQFQDVTTVPALFTGLTHQTAYSTTTVTATGTTVSGDIVYYSCLGF